MTTRTMVIARALAIAVSPLSSRLKITTPQGLGPRGPQQRGYGQLIERREKTRIAPAAAAGAESGRITSRRRWTGGTDRLRRLSHRRVKLFQTGLDRAEHDREEPREIARKMIQIVPYSVAS